MRHLLSLLCCCLFMVLVGPTAEAAASKFVFTGASPKSVTGVNSGSHIITATGTGGQLKVTCTQVSFSGSVTLNATSLTVQPSYSGCTTTYAGATFAATVTCGPFTINISGTQITATGSWKDISASSFASIVTSSGIGCDIRINANCTLRFSMSTRLTFDGRPGDNGFNITFPSTSPDRFVFYWKIFAFSIGTKSGSNCTSFGFAASPSTVSNGQYFGTQNAAASGGAPATTGAAASIFNGIWGSN